MNVTVRMVQGISMITITWNEKENIEELILRVRIILKGIPHEIVVVDDNSLDVPLEVAKRLRIWRLEKFEKDKLRVYCLEQNLPSSLC
jgi:glycosyltransferase involved in cell wall biosynthesis